MERPARTGQEIAGLVVENVIQLGFPMHAHVTMRVERKEGMKNVRYWFGPIALNRHVFGSVQRMKTNVRSQVPLLVLLLAQGTLYALRKLICCAQQLGQLVGCHVILAPTRRSNLVFR
jgi:predicted nucleotidyltransferase